MKELLRKKSVRAGLLAIVLIVAVGIAGLNVRSAQRRKEYNGHVEAAEKYLTELDYEQAIAEYTLALEIEPKSEEMLNALEQTYLAYAQSLADAGEWERAMAVLEEGLSRIGGDSLYEKREEIRKVQIPFETTDIRIADYDLYDDYFEELCGIFCEENEAETGVSGSVSTKDVRPEYGGGEGYIWESQDASGDKVISKYLSIMRPDVSFAYTVTDWASGSLDIDFTIDNRLDLIFDVGDDYAEVPISVPVMPGDNYEQWCQMMQIDKIKKLYIQDTHDRVNMWGFNNGGYSEWTADETDAWGIPGCLACTYETWIPDHNKVFQISLYMDAEGNIVHCQYTTHIDRQT